MPWNAPYYERLGFEVVADDHATEALRTIRDHEAARGLDAWPRVTMRRDLRDDLRATVEQSGEKQGARRQESSDNQDMNLPAGLTTRPLTLADATAVTAVMAAEELADTGTVAIEEADIVADWQRPSFDISTATIGVFDGPRLLGYAEHSGHDRGDTAVDPGVHGRGIGTFLAQWLEDRCRSAGAAVIGMPVPLGSPADRFLAERGYVVRWTSWILVLPPGASIPERPLPEGHVLRDALDEDLRDAWTVLEDAFLEWSERPREPFEDFLASVVDRPGHQPWNLRVLVGPDGEIVGACHIVLADDCGYVNRIAVRKGNRGLGLAQAMLADAFEHSRAHGATRSELSTDSRTGALGLYEKVGMVVSSTWVNRALTL